MKNTYNRVVRILKTKVECEKRLLMNVYYFVYDIINLKNESGDYH